MKFEEAWPEISRRLGQLLAAKHVPEAQRDDVIQETAIRLLRVWDRVEPDRGPWGLARTIALHAIADSAKAHDRYELVDSVEVPDACDGERVAIASFRLGSVARALAHMSSSDSRVLLAEVGAVSPPTLGPSAMKMARSRARLRLRRMVEKPGWWITVERSCLRIRAAYQRRVNDLPLSVTRYAEGLATAALMLTLTGSGLWIGSPVERPVAVPSHIGHIGLPVDAPQVRLARNREASAEARRVRGTTSDYLGPVEGDDGGGHSLQDYAWKDVQTLGKDAQRAGEDGGQLVSDLSVLVRYVERDSKQLVSDGKKLVDDFLR